MSARATDRVRPAELIPVDDVVRLVERLVGLSARSVVGRVVVSRAATSGSTA